MYPIFRFYYDNFYSGQKKNETFFKVPGSIKAGHILRALLSAKYYIFRLKKILDGIGNTFKSKNEIYSR